MGNAESAELRKQLQQSLTANVLAEVQSSFNQVELLIMWKLFKSLASRKGPDNDTLDEAAFMQYCLISGYWAQRLFWQLALKDRGDGIVSFERFMLFQQKYCRSDDEILDRMIFELFDLNANDKIDCQELTQMLLTMPNLGIITTIQTIEEPKDGEQVVKKETSGEASWWIQCAPKGVKQLRGDRNILARTEREVHNKNSNVRMSDVHEFQFLSADRATSISREMIKGVTSASENEAQANSMNFTQFRTWLEKNPYVRKLILHAINPNSYILDADRLPKALQKETTPIKIDTITLHTGVLQHDRECLAYNIEQQGYLVLPELKTPLKQPDDFDSDATIFSDKYSTKRLSWAQHRKYMDNKEFMYQFDPDEKEIISNLIEIQKAYDVKGSLNTNPNINPRAAEFKGTLLHSKQMSIWRSRWYETRNNVLYIYASKGAPAPKHVIFLKGLYCEECKLDKTLGVRLFSDSSDFKEIQFYHKRRDVAYLWLDCMLEQCQYYIKSKYRSKPPADKYEIDKIDKGSNKGDDRQLLDSLHDLEMNKAIHHPYIFDTREVLSQKIAINAWKQKKDNHQSLDFLLISEKRKLTRTDIVKIMRQLLEAVQFLHASGVVHRDIATKRVLIEFHESKFSNTTKIQNEIWLNIKKVAMKPGFFKSELFNDYSKTDQEIVEKLIETQGVSNETQIQGQPWGALKWEMCAEGFKDTDEDYGFSDNERVIIKQLQAKQREQGDMFDIRFKETKTETPGVKQVRLQGFNHAKYVTPGEKMTDQHEGLIAWKAPEMLGSQVEYTKQVDVWSLGVILYEMVAKSRPFARAENDTMLKKLIVGTEPDFDSLGKDDEDCVDLVKKMLKKDPSERISIEDALNHRFFGHQEGSSQPGEQQSGPDKKAGNESNTQDDSQTQNGDSEATSPTDDLASGALNEKVTKLIKEHDFLSEEHRSRLKEGLRVKELLQASNKEVTDGSRWYIIPKSWMDKELRYCFFDLLTGDRVPSSQDSDQQEEDKVESPGKIDYTQIFEEKCKFHQLLEVSSKYEWHNHQLKKGMALEEHYTLVSYDLAAFLHGRYSSIGGNFKEFMRFGRQQASGESIIEIAHFKLQLYGLPNRMKFKRDIPWFFYVPRSVTNKDLVEKVRRIISIHYGHFKKDTTKYFREFRLWMTQTDEVQFIRAWGEKINEDEVQLVEADEKVKINEMDFSDGTILVLDQILAKGAYKEPTDYVASSRPKLKLPDEDPVIPEYTLEQMLKVDLQQFIGADVTRGICGLNNLGNTCYMNSTLQCLQNTHELSRFFIFRQYLKDINDTNVLGTNGKLAEAYATLMKQLYRYPKSVDSIRPYELKRAFGNKIQRFSGFDQQDAAECANFLLDLLHEDLNRIKKKPYVEKNDAPGRTDAVAAKDAWDEFQLRNQSIIVDLMYGQLKSKLTCLTCDNSSTVFDELLTIPLPLPEQQEKMKIKYIPYNIYEFSDSSLNYEAKKALTCQLEVSDNTSILDVKRQLGATLKLDSINPDELIAFQTPSGKLEHIGNTALIRHITRSAVTTFYQVPRKGKFVAQLNWMKQDKESSRLQDIKFATTRLVALSRDQTFLEIKQYIAKYISGIWSQGFSDLEVLNSTIELFVDVRDTAWKKGKAVACDICGKKHKSGVYKCELIYKKSKLNASAELASSVTLDQFLKSRTHTDLSLFVVLKNSDQLRLSDKTKISDMTWAELKETAMLPNYIEQSPFFKYLNKRDKVTLQSLISIQTAQKESGEIKVKSSDHIAFDDLATKEMKIVTDDELAGITMASCFQGLGEIETLAGDDQWYCSKCKEHRDASKKLQLYKVPQIMIIHLKRFTQKKSTGKTPALKKQKTTLLTASTRPTIKNTMLVNYPVESLDMRPYVIELQDEPQPVYYDLYAVSNHMGSLTGGHYTATCKNSLNNQWYYFDDARVRAAKESDIVSTAGYLLYYRKRESGPESQSTKE